MWRSVSGNAGRDVFDAWMAAYKSDTSSAPQVDKVIKAKPAQATEGCYDKATPPAFIAEPLAFTSAPTTKCSALYPVYANPRFQAGGPLVGRRHEVPAQADRREGLQGAVLAR